VYHYTECGLPNVWLQNGFTIHETPYGQGVSIVDVSGLHRLIGTTLARRPRLTATGLRFLRKELGWSQKMLAKVVGSTEQTVSLWERSARIPASVDRLVRILYLEHVNDNVKVKQFVEQLAELDRSSGDNDLKFEQCQHEWREAA